MTTPMEPMEPQGPSRADDRLDAGTFSHLIEARNPHRLQLDGTWHQISRNYVWVQLIATGFWVVVIAVAAFIASQIIGEPWVWLPAAAFLIPLVWSLVILPRQARAYGYMLRQDDIVFRRGILWQRMVAVPYGRMQLVDVTHGPLDRAFHIAQLKLVTAAATTGLTIPGLTQSAAEELRDLLIEVSETRRTGL